MLRMNGAPVHQEARGKGAGRSIRKGGGGGGAQEGGVYSGGEILAVKDRRFTSQHAVAPFLVE